ncbi:PDZ domain-containing protein [Yinghuangia aomiensis]
MEGGARVLSVTEGGAADEVGIRAGDTITGFNGQTVTTSEDLRNARIGLLRAGATVPITYRRPDGSTRTTTVTLR